MYSLQVCSRFVKSARDELQVELATEDCLASKVLRRMGLELRITRRVVVTALLGIVHAQQAPAVSPVAEKSTLDAILERLEAIEGRLDR